MKTIAWTLTIALMFSVAAAAQGGRGGGGRGGAGFASRLVGPMLGGPADANHDKKITKDEWTKLISSVSTEKGLDLGKLKTKIATSGLDKDHNGKVDQKDLDATFKALDRNEDSIIQSNELGVRTRGQRGGRGQGGRGGRGGFDREAMMKKYDKDGDGELNEEERTKMMEELRAQRGGGQGGQDRQRNNNASTRVIDQLFVKAADADKNNEVTKDEWTKYTKTIVDDKGVVKPDAIKKIATAKAEQPAQPEGEEGGRRRRGGRGGNSLQMLDRVMAEMDADALTEMFGDMDKDGNGEVSAEELRPQRRGRGQGGQGGGRRRID